jgi:hypothetical protein
MKPPQRKAKTIAEMRIEKQKRVADTHLVLPTAEISDISGDEEEEELIDIEAQHLAEYELVDLDEEENEEAPEEELYEALGEEYRWRKHAPAEQNTMFEDMQNDDHEEDNDIYSPYDFAKKFFTNELISLIVAQSNIYSVQQTGKSANITNDEVERFIGKQTADCLYSLTRAMYFLSHFRDTSADGGIQTATNPYVLESEYIRFPNCQFNDY